MGVNFNGFSNYQKMKDNRGGSNKTISKPPGWACDDATSWPVGSVVFHAVYGKGRVTRSDNGKNTVFFEWAGSEKVVSKSFLFESAVRPSSAEANGWNE